MFTLSRKSGRSWEDYCPFWTRFLVVTPFSHSCETWLGIVFAALAAKGSTEFTPKGRFKILKNMLFLHNLLYIITQTIFQQTSFLKIFL
jgi:hypothetical protein